MSARRPLLAAAAALAFLLVTPGPVAGTTPDLTSLDSCKDDLDDAFFISPKRPHARAPLRIMLVTERQRPDAGLILLGPDGTQDPLAYRAFGGPPWGRVAEVEQPTPGTWRVALVNGDGVVACQSIRVRRHRLPYKRVRVPEEEDPVWRPGIKWERDTENLFSLWVEHLFDAPADADLSWKRLDLVLQDRARNLLYDHYGWDEDTPGKGLKLKPDCADFPYTLRAYFAWKLRLPFTYRTCTRGRGGRAPRCAERPRSNYQATEETDALAAFEHFARRSLAGSVHSSSGRTTPTDPRSDFYPVALTRRSLRPGTTYFDPYGHAMIIAKWYPPTDGGAGVLVAADAQPDGTVGRRFFWRGSFLFPEDGAVAGAGFKRFRPSYQTSEGVAARTNEAITRSVDYGDFSVDQWSLGKDGFYEAMDALITPTALPPERVLTATLDALEQQVRRRVQSVDNVEAYKRQRPGKIISMPQGASIFLTAGPWEDYSTPSRDMRLLIALDAARGVPGRVERYPARFVLPAGTSPAAARQALEATLKARAGERTFTYTRSDGSPWTLSLADVLDRITRFEMAYNPNACPETRWCAPPGSAEAATCEAVAPAAQRQRMATYRPWFEKRERPRR